MPIHDPTKPLAKCLDENFELAVKCEELGFDDFWVGEHYSSSVENIVMPEIFLAKVLDLTKRIRIGPAAVCLQYHHPVHVAGRLAFLDHLSHGRLNPASRQEPSGRTWRSSERIPKTRPLAFPKRST